MTQKPKHKNQVPKKLRLTTEIFRWNHRILWKQIKFCAPIQSVFKVVTVYNLQIDSLSLMYMQSSNFNFMAP
jgi:hypothetical protein